jgi:hypothetical protein
MSMPMHCHVALLRFRKLGLLSVCVCQFLQLLLLVRHIHVHMTHGMCLAGYG